MFEFQAFEFQVKSGDPEKQRTGCVVVGVFEPRKLSPEAESLDRASDGAIGRILRRGDMEGKLGSTLLLHDIPNTLCDRVLLVGLGKEREFRDHEYQKAVAAAVGFLHETGSLDASLYLSELPVRKRDLAWKVEQTVLVSFDKLYRYEKMKSEPEKGPRKPLRRLVIHVPGRGDLKEGEAAIQRGEAIAQGLALARDLANAPANICTPSFLARTAQELAGEFGLEVEILEKSDVEALGMGAFLAVAQGSQEPPKFIVLKYRGAAEAAPVVLVGKGITFDSGGISLKPAADMDEMKFDMGGAAAVLGTLKSVALMKIPLNVFGVIPACENLPSGTAQRPGDILKSLSGQTIEVLNTDAEGRLILADALTYCERFSPDTVVDVATLTGACVVALGHVVSGLFSAHEPLARSLMQAAEESGDRVWRLPLLEEYQEALKSNFADVANVGGRAGGAATAACFLWRFAKKFPWAHLDIAGTAYKGGKEKGATGRPVPLLVHYLAKKAQGNGED